MATVRESWISSQSRKFRDHHESMKTLKLLPAKVILCVTIVCLLLLGSLQVSAQNTNLTGLVKDASGEPVAGALVKVKNDNAGVGFMVVSQAQGRYNTPNLPAGKYTIQVFGAGYQSAPAGDVDVKSGQQGKLDLVLNVPLKLPARAKRMTDDDFDKLMPDDGENGIKQILVSDCKECHTLQWTASARMSREKWEAAVDRMYNDLLGRRLPLWFALKDDEFAGGKRKSIIVDYLAKNFGPNVPVDPKVADQLPPERDSIAHPYRNLPVALLKGAAAKYTAMEFSLPAGSVPDAIALDSQGIAWVSERNTGMIGRFDPNTLSYTRIACPPGKNGKPQLNSIEVDSENRVWFADDGPNARIVQYNPKTQQFNSFAIPDYPWAVPEAGPARIGELRYFNGRIWATRMTAQRILKLDPGTQEVSEYSVPRGSVPYGLAVGGDKMLWYSARVGNVIVRFDPTTNRLTAHDVHTERSDLRGIAADAQGNLWTAAMESGKLLKTDYKTGEVTEYTPPTEDSGPLAVDVDTRRNLVWFSEYYSDKIGRFDPSNNSFVEFPSPSADSDMQRIEVDQNHPNRVWWAGAQSDKIGYLETIE